MSAGRRTVLVTVATPYGALDACVAADVPVFQLLPSLLAATGGSGGTEAVERARWRLVGEDGRLLAPRQSLAAAAVLDGERLRMIPDMTTTGGGP